MKYVKTLRTRACNNKKVVRYAVLFKGASQRCQHKVWRNRFVHKFAAVRSSIRLRRLLAANK